MQSVSLNNGDAKPVEGSEADKPEIHSSSGTLISFRWLLADCAEGASLQSHAWIWAVVAVCHA